MKFLIKIAAIAAMSLSAVSAQAAVLVTFSFSNDPEYGNVPGTVTGTIAGLSDNATGAATGITLTSYPAGLNNAGYSSDVFSWADGTIYTNSFTITNGVVTGSDFIIQTPAQGTQLWLNGQQSYNFLGLDGATTLYTYNGGGASGVTYTVSQVSAAPEPATWAMLILGFGLAGATLRRRRTGVSTRPALT